MYTLHAAVARCAHGGQDVTQGAHAQIAGLCDTEQEEAIFANLELHNKYTGSK